MPVILIANPKGGVGKTTLATQLAGALAWAGCSTMLGDLDRQQSALAWLALRPAQLPLIQSWQYQGDGIARPPRGVTHLVLDAPAGVHGHLLKDALRLTDRVIVPLQPSMFDIYATQTFLGKLAERGVLRDGGRVAVLGNRVHARTRALEQLEHYVQGLGIASLGFLRDTQTYVQLAARGLTLWDVAPARVAQDLAQWQPIVDWVLGRTGAPAAATG